VHILLTRPDSYLGVRLMYRFLGDPDVRLRLLTRDARRIDEEASGRAEIVEGDPLDAETLARAVKGIDVAYFPTRFLRSDFVNAGRNRRFARLFRDACIDAGVGRIVFLGVRGRKGEDTGHPFRSLAEIGEILSARPEAIRTVCLSNDYILGSGSLLFEAVRGMARNAPVLLAPRWMNATPAVTGVADTIEYMVRAARLPRDRSIVVDIGLPPVSIRDLVSRTAEAMGRKLRILPVPGIGRRASTLLLTLASPLSWRLASSLIGTLARQGRAETGSPEEDARAVFPEVSPIPVDRAIRRALLAIDEDRVASRWTDSLAGQARTDADAAMAGAKFCDVRRERFGPIPPHRIFRAVTSIGGSAGWFTFDILWQIRGFIDKLAGGYGTAVGRRTATGLRVGDFLDVWRVVDLQEDKRLLLEAQMKVAGKAWLEFRIEGDTLVQTACHVPEGIAGHLYWYSMLPFHAFIFSDMIRSIVRRATEME
jgi:uncharacterized protein YbjT (DUF2867 family)